MESDPFIEVLDFWFGPRETRGKARAEWFRKDEKFDAQIAPFTLAVPNALN